MKFFKKETDKRVRRESSSHGPYTSIEPYSPLPTADLIVSYTAQFQPETAAAAAAAPDCLCKPLSEVGGRSFVCVQLL
jgi:hypothetical protein